MTDLKRLLGQRLREFRNAAGYSIEELAHFADLNAVHLASLERGEKNITIATLEKVVNALGISFIDVFSFSESIEASPDPLVSKTSSLLSRLPREDQEYLYQTALFLSEKNKR